VRLEIDGHGGISYRKPGLAKSFSATGDDDDDDDIASIVDLNSIDLYLKVTGCPFFKYKTAGA
jgi:hypothetical protein